jgi:hypothetical protein
MLHTLAIGMTTLVLLAGATRASLAWSEVRLEIKSQNGIRYVSGGVSSEDEDAIKQLAKDFALRVTFATASGSYLGGGVVEVRDRAGKKVLEARSDGPLFFAELPPGKYTVKATSGSEDTRTKEIQVTPGNQVRVSFQFKDETS